MEPVFMVLAQSAAMAASIAIDNKSRIQAVNIKFLQDKLQNDPLADGSIAEILIDDTKAKIISGEWKKETVGGYGPTMLLNHDELPAVVRFEPEVKMPGKYSVYFYYPGLQHASDQLDIKVYNGKSSVWKTLNSKDIVVTGQTSGEWVSLGVFDLPAGKNAHVDISNKGAKGAIAADAVLFVPIHEQK
jgi:hypothetical protein